MIKAEPAAGTEPWGKDIQRNRILLVVGERSWHLSREEAERLSADLLQALNDSEYATFEGVVCCEGSKIFLEIDEGSRLLVYPSDWSIRKQQGRRAQIVGVYLERSQDTPQFQGADVPQLHMKEWTPVES